MTSPFVLLLLLVVMTSASSLPNRNPFDRLFSAPHLSWYNTDVFHHSTIGVTTPKPKPLDFHCGNNFRGYGYMVLNAPVINYHTATALCARYGATLPHHNMKTIKNRRHVMKLAGITQNFFHLGMTDEAREGTWKWTDGTVVDQDALGWDHDEPNGQRWENCAISWMKTNPDFLYTVNDIPCSYETHYNDHIWNLKGRNYHYKPVVVCAKKC